MLKIFDCATGTFQLGDRIGAAPRDYFCDSEEYGGHFWNEVGLNKKARPQVLSSECESAF